MKKLPIYCGLPGLILLCCSLFVQAVEPHASVSLQIDTEKRLGQLKPIYAWFGYDEPNYTYMQDGRKLLTEIYQLSPVPVYVRAHSLLNTGDGTPALKWGSTNAYTEDEDGNPVYD